MKVENKLSIIPSYIGMNNDILLINFDDKKFNLLEIFS